MSMSVQAALEFIQAVRQDENLKYKIRMLMPEVNIENLVQVGMEAGFEYTPEELNIAYRHDWTMRSLRYGITTGNVS
ncbi:MULTISPECIES: Nif11-like leader peptide family natural product precursor [Aerosakkonema]|uniref:Nif11-like leader peptide family natural product precursor n=1 Tax=Aerosakkonema TaxID=1246629 RepID=UPI0035BB7E06